ncbi:hypothetical protein M0R45_031573 [Rubus argutus]|uniref:RING-type E3 ubiquitin transferase n=1 Tax=Rubus argutus TaxID=59490 RepID=A0AAW1WGL1_RUBAR
MEEHTGDSISPREVHYLISKAEQVDLPYLRRSDLSEDYIFVRFGHCRIAGPYSRRRREVIWEPLTVVEEVEFWFHLPSLKRENREWNPDYYRRKCKRKIFSSLSFMRVPEAERPNTVSKFFQVVEEAVSAAYPIDVGVWDITLRLVDNYEDEVVPAAASSSIEGLEKVRLDSLDFATRSSPCPICLEDFEEPSGGVDQLLPRLPCLHHFHLHCIIPWLEKNHLCPVCRYPMPTN